MSTSTFDRKLEITNDKDLDRLAKFLSRKPSCKEISKHPFNDKEIRRGEQLLDSLFSNSQK